jgi:hypothetical protein
LLAAFQLQPLPAFTPTLPVPAPEPKLWLSEDKE